MDALIISGYVIGIITLIIGITYGIYKELRGE